MENFLPVHDDLLIMIFYGGTKDMDIFSVVLNMGSYKKVSLLKIY